MRTPWTTTGRSRATAVVELLILLPVLLLILLTMDLAGHLGTYKQRTHFASEYALDAPGDQSEDAATRGTVTERFYDSATGELTVVETAAEPADVPEPGEIRAMFDDMSQTTYSVYAVGRYVFEGGHLRFVVTTHQNRTLSKDGRYVARYRLREGGIPELCEDLLLDWVRRVRADVTYRWGWLWGEQTDYLRPGLIAERERPLEFGTSLQSAVRGEKKREVTNPPPGMNHQIDTVTSHQYMPGHGRLPHYPDFSGDEPFWEPN